MAPSDCKVLGFHLPKTKIQVRQFLGLAVYFNQFSPHYVVKARLLHQASCKTALDCVVWCNAQLNVFILFSLLSLPTLSLLFQLYPISFYNRLMALECVSELCCVWSEREKSCLSLSGLGA